MMDITDSGFPKAVIRQLVDIQVYADRIINGSIEMQSMIAFAHYSKELKDYIMSNVIEPEVQAILQDIPEIDVKNLQYKWWHEFVFPFRWFFAIRKIKAIAEARDLVFVIRGKFAAIEFIILNKQN